MYHNTISSVHYIDGSLCHDCFPDVTASHLFIVVGGGIIHPNMYRKRTARPLIGAMRTEHLQTLLIPTSTGCGRMRSVRWTLCPAIRRHPTSERELYTRFANTTVCHIFHAEIPPY
jgi:hypothetical protein